MSEGVWQSLNAGLRSGDDPDRVLENRRRIAAAQAVPPAALVTVRQIHSNLAVHIDQPFPDDAVPEADGLVSCTSGLLLGVLGADCAPVLFADPVARVVGALHAGWRGACDGIVEAVVDAMERAGADRTSMNAAIGPAIAQQSYEVGEDFKALFTGQHFGVEKFFTTNPMSGKPHFDLPGFLHERLAAIGVGAIDDLGRDTLEEPETFFSFRRAQQHNQKQFGLQMSVIGLTPD